MEKMEKMWTFAETGEDLGKSNNELPEGLEKRFVVDVSYGAKKYRQSFQRKIIVI